MVATLSTFANEEVGTTKSSRPTPSSLSLSHAQGGHHTLPGPLLFNAQYLIRLQFPLGYNFMRILRYYGTNSSRTPALQLPAFQQLMNDMTTVPVLGTGFNVYAPLVLVVLCAFTYYKVRDCVVFLWARKVTVVRVGWYCSILATSKAGPVVFFISRGRGVGGF